MRDPGAASRLVGDAQAQLAAATDDVRRIVRGLRPPALDDVGLAGAIRAYAEAATGTMRVAIASDALDGLPAATEAAAYAIAMEAITNAVRHSGATRCDVALRRGSDDLVLRIEDDGRGTDERGADRRGTDGRGTDERGTDDTTAGLGIASMQRRARELGGVVLVEHAPTGTTVVARLPIAAGVAAPEPASSTETART
ncbi:sensor histidine kinase [Agromyces mangrovi Wang et al. 2018]|uniref:sensor histidine kinase n=1 Tax=Agromyces mangrovi TaxID=1858653 RepID=UPI0025742B04|nr:ATP-binding protein [Agromyces mangrovi]BDZ63704.1 two-component sensor histidine kinase [Agromyces mangrovi]